MGGKPIPPDLARGLCIEVDELNLVRSGLFDSMRTAYNDIRTIWKTRDNVPDLRIAAFVKAIQKIARHY
jgi:glutamate dehydrogenase (NAD(P)+)